MPRMDSQRRWPAIGLAEITIDLLQARAGVAGSVNCGLRHRRRRLVGNHQPGLAQAFDQLLDDLGVVPFDILLARCGREVRPKNQTMDKSRAGMPGTLHALVGHLRRMTSIPWATSAEHVRQFLATRE